MEYQVDGESITPAEFEADSRCIRAVKAHRAAAAHHPITLTPPSSTPSQETPRPPNTTPSAPTPRRHAPLPQLPAEDVNIVFRPGGGLDLRTTTNGDLLQTLCSPANIDYAAARTADRVRINSCNNSLSAPHLSHAHVSTSVHLNSAWIPSLTPYVPTWQHQTAPSVASSTTLLTPKHRTRSSKISSL
ncbi:hypothetical protein HPB51_028331 [Rhipicephalus microplus]|uniref:Uncharacterized protein n=1 Tax=Rhipicephalus microplus TaxID=6941 RepID=A0A9J6CXU1_RHIMP|nr:hypothetical protein HPB51_028331 [Rhipicephalus microplus]